MPRIIFLIFFSLCECSFPLYAQIALDGTIHQPIDLSGPNYQIQAKLGQQQGNHLFYSFSTFNLHAGESATFSGPKNITNIISRVTGGSPSTIDGLLRSRIPNADVYFLNPAGILFGANASLDIPGSFYVSTADALHLGPEGQFAVSQPENTVLTVAPPSAFGFLTETPASLSIQGSTLSTKPDKGFSLIGGDIQLEESTLLVPVGRLNLASVASKGQAIANSTTLDVSDFSELGDIFIKDSFVGTTFIEGFDNDRWRGRIELPDLTDHGGGGDIFIRSGYFELDRSSLIAGTLGEGNGGQIDIQVEQLKGFGENQPKQLEITTIVSGTLGQGQGGDIQIKATDSIDLTGVTISANSGVGGMRKQAEDFVSQPLSDTHPLGSAGHVMIETNQLNLDDVIISSETSGAGQGGNVLLTVEGHTRLNNSRILVNTVGGTEVSAGEAGQIRLFSKHLEATDSIITSSTWGVGHGGHILLTAMGTVDLINTKIHADSGQGILFESEQEDIAGKENLSLTLSPRNHFPLGDAGAIKIKANQLNLSDSFISSDSYGTGQGGHLTLEIKGLITLVGSRLFSNSYGATSEPAGDAGEIMVIGEQLQMTNESIISSSTAGTGQGGEIALKIKGQLKLNESHIAVGSFIITLNDTQTVQYPQGSAGQITIDAQSVVLKEESNIISSTEGRGQGGDIFIKANQALVLDNVSGEEPCGISADSFSTQANSGNAGRIWIETPHLLLTGDTVISTSTVGDGHANEIYLKVNELKLKQGAILSISEGSGNAGNIHIEAQKAVQLQKEAQISTQVLKAEGGNITLTIGQFIDLLNSHISTNVLEGTGSGGHILVTKPLFIVLDKSRIVTSAVTGNGGNITLETREFVKDPKSLLDASSQLGLDGTILITSPLININQKMMMLPMTFLEAGQFIEKSCQTRSGEDRSRFVSVGHQGLPPSPDEFQSSSLSSDNLF